MRPKLFFLIVTSIALFSVLLTVLAYNFYMVYDIKTEDMFVSVTEKTMGFNLETDALYFGQVSKGNRAERVITIFNEDNVPAKINIKVDGDMAPWITVEDNLFDLLPGQNETLRVYVRVPLDAEVGSYSGKFHVYYMRR